MGGKFTQIIVKGPEQADIVETLRAEGRRASVGPTVNGFTILSDEACESFNRAAIQTLAERLSRAHEAPCLAVHYFDDDVLSYWLYADGVLRDDYNSCPDYYDFAGEHIPPRPPMGGDVERLARAFVLAAQQKAAVEQALHAKVADDLEEEFGEEIGSIVRSHDLDALRDLMGRMMSSEPGGAGSGIDIGDAFEAQWRYEHLMAGLGAPEYGMHFVYGVEDDMQGLPPGSIVNV